MPTKDNEEGVGRRREERCLYRHRDLLSGLLPAGEGMMGRGVSVEAATRCGEGGEVVVGGAGNIGQAPPEVDVFNVG